MEIPRRALVALAILAACARPDTAKLYATQPKAPSLEASAIEALDTLGTRLVDKGVNFSVYSERAERIELLLFDDPESNTATREIPLTRFGDVWNIYVEGVGLGQHYGFRAWGPNWPYSPDFVPGTITGFKADVDADGNRFNPNKLLFDPYGRALHRDHDWSKGSLATGPKRTEVTYAASAKSVIVKSQYAWSENEAAWRAERKKGTSPGHRPEDLILYEVHPKGFTASPASGVQHPGTYRGLGEKAAYIKELGVNAVELMPIHEKPLDGGYWGYATLSFFAPELSYASRTGQAEVIDEFKWMVDQLHQQGLQVFLDVVYNHTGEGGFWRTKLEFDLTPDPSISAVLGNFDPKEITSLYSYRGLDNAAYYALSDDNQSYFNNTGVGNQSRPNHKPFKRMVLDSLHYMVEELHVDGFRFDLAPVLGERDKQYSWWEDPKNTVLQEIVDDPLLTEYNVQVIAEPWGAGGYDGASFAQPPSAQNAFGVRVGSFPGSLTTPGRGWGEWNGRFRDWWRAFINFDEFKLNSTEVKDGGFFLTGSQDWYGWNGRRPPASVNFITVHDGFPLYDVFSYAQKQNKCGPLNPTCCSMPLSPFCEKDSGETNNRSRDWGQGQEPFKRQLMRNAFVAMLVSHGTPLLYGGDEWLRTQLGNNNAYSTGADNEYNWFDWGTWQAQDERWRMADFVKQLTRFRREHGYAVAPAEYGKGAPFAWKSAANTDQVNWGGKAVMMHYFDKTRGPELAILVNMEPGSTDFTLPAGRNWVRLIDTQQYFDLPATLTAQQKPARQSNNAWMDAPTPVTTPTYGVPGRSIVILEAR